MRIVSFIFCLVVAQFAFAEDRAAQAEAARVAAVARIAEMIDDEPLGRGVTAGQFIDSMDARDKLWTVLSEAQQVGGVRWIDDETCQVRVDVPAVKVGQLILDLSLAKPNKSLVPYDLLDRQINRWTHRSFSATASSLSWDRAEQLAPPGAWRKVDSTKRRTALEAARADAARQYVRSVLISRDDGGEATSGDAGGDEEIAQWIAAQPVTAVQYRDDQTVSVSLAIEPAELRRRFGDRVPPSVSPIARGVGRIDDVNDARGAVVIPGEPPRWADQLIDAVGEAQFAGSPLKTARLAERDAAAKLRDHVRDLPWSPGQNIGEAAMLDAALSDATDSALTQAKIAKVDYRADGSVQVRLTLAGQTVWRSLAFAGTGGHKPIPTRAK